MKNLKKILKLNLFDSSKYLDEDTQLATAHYNLHFKIILAAGVLGGALVFGSDLADSYLDKRFSKYKSIEERRKIYQQNNYRNQFQILDKNNDDVIDSTEYIYRE